MNTIELRYELERLEAKYPGRELIVKAASNELGIRVMVGILAPPNPDESLGRGVGSKWERIEIPDPDA